MEESFVVGILVYVMEWNLKLYQRFECYTFDQGKERLVNGRDDRSGR